MSKRNLTAGLTLLSTLTINACGASRTMYLGESSTKTVRLRETVKNVKVWVLDSTNVAHPSVADLPEGGFYRNDLRK